MNIRLDNLTAIVTGAAHNIGRAIAVALADAGASVVVTAKTSENAAETLAESIRGSSGRAIAIRCDVQNMDHIRDVVERTRTEFGAVHIIVNNAAIRPHQAFLSISDVEWHTVLDTNLTGPFALCRAALPDMVSAGFGRIINISGIDALMPVTERAHSITSKAGLLGLTRALAFEFGEQGITCNAVAPGMVNTVRPYADEPWFTQLKGRIDALSPIKRAGEPEEIAGLCCFLASKEAAFLNGQVFHVNGGTLMGTDNA